MSQSKIYRRQQDIITPSQLDFGITILGTGGIGSMTTFCLAKMGAMALTIIDFDKVEEHNMPSQMYGPEDVGKSKVDALQVIVRLFTGITPIPFNGTAQEYAASGLPFGRVVICAVDSLEERKKIWEVIKPLLGGIDLYIDARMGGETLRAICVSPRNVNSIIKYQAKMDKNQVADPTPCTEGAVVYNTFTIAGYISSIVKKYAKRQDIDFDYMWDLTNLERV